MDVGLQPLYCIGSVFWTAVGSIRACAQCVHFPVVFLVLYVPLLFLPPFLSHFSLPIVLLIAFPPPLTSCILSSSLYSSFPLFLYFPPFFSLSFSSSGSLVQGALPPHLGLPLPTAASLSQLILLVCSVGCVTSMRSCRIHTRTEAGS